MGLKKIKDVEGRPIFLSAKNPDDKQPVFSKHSALAPADVVRSNMIDLKARNKTSARVRELCQWVTEAENELQELRRKIAARNGLPTKEEPSLRPPRVISAINSVPGRM